MIRILIADDHKIVREGLKAFVLPNPELQVIGEARDGQDALDKALALKPDVILMDLVMPGMDGIAATQAILQQQPGARVLILSSFAADEQVVAAVKAGALGYLLKDSSPQELQDAIHAVHQGESYLPPRIARKVINLLNQPAPPPQPVSPLTGREHEILALVAVGLSNMEIANRLVLSPWTVRSHIGSILRKLNLENRTQAALYALREGLVPAHQ